MIQAVDVSSILQKLRVISKYYFNLKNNAWPGPTESSWQVLLVNDVVDDKMQ